MTDQGQDPRDAAVKRGFSPLQVLAMVAVSICITLVITVLIMKTVLFPSPFTAVTLSPDEEKLLSQKLESFVETPAAMPPAGGASDDFGEDGSLRPEQYSEQGSSREINFSERELNGLLAKNTDLANKVAIDLSRDMVSIKLLIPLEQDLPIVGGKTLRVNAGAEIAYRQGRPVVKLKGLSLMGVPMPNSWLGGLKNIDLVDEFAGDQGFWKSFADGVESMGVKDGQLTIELKE